MNTLVEDFFRTLQRVMNYPVFPGNGITVSSLIILILLFGFVLVLERAVCRHFVARLLRRTHLEPAMQFALAKIAGYCLLALGFYISFQVVGINLSSLAIIAGAVGVGLGFGLQNVISNFISGLIILAERPIAVGDRIEVGGVVGEVREISLRSTTVVTSDNIAIIVPNADFITQRVTNWSYGDAKVRFRIPFGVAYGTDVEKLRGAVVQVARDHPKVLKEPAPDLMFSSFGDSAMNFELVAWTEEMISTPLRFKSDLLFGIEAALRNAGIEIPFPQREIRIRTANESAVDTALQGSRLRP
jgi:small-conductance mechanosensitive channel